VRPAYRYPGAAAAVLLLPVAALAAQAPECARSMAAAHPAPAATLDSIRPPDGTSRYDMTVQRPGDSMPTALGTMTVKQTTTRCARDRVIQRVIVYDYGASGRVVDTTLSVASSLAPILERTHKTSGHIVLDFDAIGVRGELTRGADRRVINDTLMGPAFNSTDLELVVRSLALRPGWATEVQIYDPEFGGYRTDSISVASHDPAPAGQLEGYWVVRSRDRRLESLLQIGERTRTLLSMDIRADSTRYRLVLTYP